MTTTTPQGFNYKIERRIVKLLIPKTKSEHSVDVQEAKQWLCINSDELPYFKEIKIKKY